MKFFLLFVCLGLYCSASTTQEKDQAYFLQANTLYHQREYQKALESYQKIQKKWYAVWFNLGNCAYQLANYSQAYAYWLQSEQGSPYALQSKLEQHYRKLTDEHNIPCLRSLYRRCVMRIPLCVAQVLCILLWSFFCLLLLLQYWEKRPYFLIGMFFVACGSGILVFMCYSALHQKHVVTKEHIFLYAGPNKQYHIVGSLDTMCSVVVKDTYNGNWYKVDSHALVGWLSKEDSVSV